MKRFRSLLPILLILLIAFALRAVRLTDIPPGLTHDEANHGREAIGILAGKLALFFPLNYGSEPLYSYTVAGSMALLGQNLLALRLVNVFFSVGAIAATYLWARRALGRATALLGAGLLAVSFWPLASGREALRAGMMPFFTAGAAIFFWRLLNTRPGSRRRAWFLAGFVLCLTATLYNYLAARVLWLLFPAFLAYLGWLHRDLLRRVWRPALLGLLLVGLLVVPMFLYLEANPASQTRLQMLDSTLTGTLQGEIGPVLANAGNALLAFVWPGRGDQFLAYNIPGRPVFDAVTAIFFLVGVGVSLWRWRRPAYAFLLLWFVVGISPSLITGPTANTTRNLGALSPTFLLPAVGFVALARWMLVRAERPDSSLEPAPNRWHPAKKSGFWVVAVVWLLVAGGVAARDYFVHWAQAPDVRAAYQHTLAEMLAYDEEAPAGPAVISSVYPGPAHNPSIAQVLADPEQDLHWVDARFALLWPAGAGARLLVPAATPLYPAFTPWVETVAHVELRPDDLNPTFTAYRLRPGNWPTSNPIRFGRGDPALALLGAEWLGDAPRPGEETALLTVWRVDDPAGVGPSLPYLDVTDVSLFTHVLDGAGAILTQQDALDAPSWQWQAGDVIVQIHPLTVPAETTPGLYETVVGVYDKASGDRLPLLDGADTRATVAPLPVVAP